MDKNATRLTKPKTEEMKEIKECQFLHNSCTFMYNDLLSFVISEVIEHKKHLK